MPLWELQLDRNARMKWFGIPKRTRHRGDELSSWRVGEEDRRGYQQIAEIILSCDPWCHMPSAGRRQCTLNDLLCYYAWVQTITPASPPAICRSSRFHLLQARIWLWSVRLAICKSFTRGLHLLYLACWIAVLVVLSCLQVYDRDAQTLQIGPASTRNCDWDSLTAVAAAKILIWSLLQVLIYLD